MQILQKFISYNKSSRNGRKITYIVIHDTGNKNVGANAMAHYKYFSGGNRNASAHYFVDDSQIIQIIKDEEASWHCGDGAGKYGITNANSIGIEICVNQDGNYEKAFNNAVELTKMLMKKYNIPIERIVRHYDASRKLCPASMSPNNWAKWQEFKEKLVDKPKPISKPISKPILKRGSKGNAVKELQTILNRKGYKLAIDGSFGPATENAIKAFQLKNKLISDGIAGPKTWEALLK